MAHQTPCVPPCHRMPCSLLLLLMSICREPGLPVCPGPGHFGRDCMSGGGLMLSWCWCQQAAWCDVVSSLHPFRVLVLCGKESFATGRPERRGATPRWWASPTVLQEYCCLGLGDFVTEVPASCWVGGTSKSWGRDVSSPAFRQGWTGRKVS